MNCKKRFFGSTDGRTRIACRFYTPDCEPRGVIQVTHGICECMDQYEKLAEFFTSYGYAVCGHDSIGHGASVSSEEQLGHFSDNGGYRFLVGDFLKMNRLAAKEYPDVPIYAIGHSMGSFVLRLALTSGRLKCDGAFLLGTSEGYGAAPLNAAVMLMVKRLHGPCRREKNIMDGACRFFNLAIHDNDSLLAWISRDADAVADCEKRFFIMTSAAYYDLMKMILIQSDETWIKRVRRDIPITVMAGTADAIGNYGADSRRVYERLKAAGHKNTALKLYKNARHELVHEYNTGTVFEDILGRVELLTERKRHNEEIS